MSVFCPTIYLPRRATRLAIFAGVCAGICVSVAYGQSEDAALFEAAATTPPPYALFQSSTLTGSGNAITATWVPIVNSLGKTAYKSITLLFNVDASGNLTVAAGYPKVLATPPPTVAGFRAGRYVGPRTVFSGEAIITISGPGVTNGGATEWSLGTASGAYYNTYPASATWYAGSSAGGPLAARINAAKITGTTATAWSFGIGGGLYGGNGGFWYSGSLLGFSQTGNALTIVSFTNSSGKDSPEPLDQITYMLQ